MAWSGSPYPWSPRQQHRVLSTALFVFLLLSFLARRLEAYTSRPQQSLARRPIMAIGSVPRRTHALRFGLVASVLALAGPSSPFSWVGPPAAAAASTGGVRSLVNLMRIQAFTKELAASVDATPEGAAPEMKTQVMAQIKYIVKEMQMRASVEDAASALGGGDAARRHGRDAFEYISSIIEFSGYDEMRKKTVSKFNTLSSNERVAFAVRCLQACDRELDAFFASFPRAKVDEARELYRAYFAPFDEGS